MDLMSNEEKFGLQIYLIIHFEKKLGLFAQFTYQFPYILAPKYQLVPDFNSVL